MVLFRCHVGHIVSGTLLFQQQGEIAEASLWRAIRTFEDRSVLGRQLAQFARIKSDADSAQNFEKLATEAEEAFHALRSFAEHGQR